MAKMTRGEMQDLLGKFAMENSTYRDTLMKNPRAIVEKQFNMALAPNVKVKVVEETADTIYVIVPPKSAQAGELDDSDLSSSHQEGRPSAEVASHNFSSSLAAHSRQASS